MTSTLGKLLFLWLGTFAFVASSASILKSIREAAAVAAAAAAGQPRLHQQDQQLPTPPPVPEATDAGGKMAMTTTARIHVPETVVLPSPEEASLLETKDDMLSFPLFLHTTRPAAGEHLLQVHRPPVSASSGEHPTTKTAKHSEESQIELSFLLENTIE